MGRKVDNQGGIVTPITAPRCSLWEIFSADNSSTIETQVTGRMEVQLSKKRGWRCTHTQGVTDQGLQKVIHKEAAKWIVRLAEGIQSAQQTWTDSHQASKAAWRILYKWMGRVQIGQRDSEMQEKRTAHRGHGDRRGTT